MISIRVLPKEVSTYIHIIKRINSIISKTVDTQVYKEFSLAHPASPPSLLRDLTDEDDDDLNPEAWTFYASVANVEELLTEEGKADKALYSGLVTTTNTAIVAHLTTSAPQRDAQAAKAVA